MPSEIQVDSNSIQSVLIILITVAIGCYLFYELRKLKQTIEDLNKDVSIMKSKFNLLNQMPSQQIPSQQQSSQQIPSQQHEQQKINPIDPLNINSSSTIEPLSNFFKKEEIQHSTLPSDVSSNISKDDIEKLMLTDSDEEDILGGSSDSDIDDTDDKLELTGDDLITELDDEGIDLLNVNTVNEDVNKDNEDVNKDNEDVDYTSLTVNELKEILVSNNLPVSGNKTKLIQRIQENKK